MQAFNQWPGDLCGQVTSVTFDCGDYMHVAIVPGSTDCYVAGNRPFAGLSHVLGYHLATDRRMASHLRVHSDHKALSTL